MNTIWNVEEPKDAGMGWYLRTYLVSFAGILSLGFLLAVSLVISTGLAALSSWAGATSTVIGEAINFVASLAILTGLFAMLFKWFPDTEIAWADVLPGAVVTGCCSTSASLPLAGTSAPRDWSRPTVPRRRS